VFGQEVFTDRGIIKALQEGESSAVTALACFITLIGGFTSIIYSADEEEKDYVDRVVSRKDLQSNAADANWRPETVKKPYYIMQPSQTQVSDPVSYEAYLRIVSAAGTSSTQQTMDQKRALTAPSVVYRPPDPPRETESAEDGIGRVSYQIIPPNQPSPLWSDDAHRRSRLSPRTYASIIADGHRNPLPAYGIPAAPAVVISATQTPFTRSARLPVTELALFDKPDPNVGNMPEAYDTSRWSLELAELWNGRFAQIAFVAVVAQETWQRKGVLRGIEQSDPINLVALLSTFLAMVGVGAVFMVSLGESQVSTRAPAVLSEQPAGERTTEESSEVADPSNYKVAGYRFNKDTPTTIFNGETSSTHPDGKFYFNADIERAIKDGAGKPAYKPAGKPATKSDLSRYKVDGYRFAPNTPTTIAVGDESLQAAGTQTLNTNTAGVNQSPPADAFDPSNPKVGGYRFKPETQTAIHPGGTFQFGDLNSSAIKIGYGVQIDPAQAQPPKDMIPHPVKGFVFSQENVPIIKAATRNTSVPMPDDSSRSIPSSSTYESNASQYDSVYQSNGETARSLPADSNGYIPVPNYDSAEYSHQGPPQNIEQATEAVVEPQQQQIRRDRVYVGLNSATTSYLESLGDRWEE
jgi:hypothetical protein